MSNEENLSAFELLTMKKVAEILQTELTACYLWCKDNGINRDISHRMLNMLEQLTALAAILCDYNLINNAQIDDIKAYLATELYARLQPKPRK